MAAERSYNDVRIMCRLEEVMRENLVTHKDIMKDFGWSRQRLNSYIMGTRTPPYPVMVSVSRYLHVPVDDIWCDY